MHVEREERWFSPGGAEDAELLWALSGVSGAAQPASFFFFTTCTILMWRGGTEEEIPHARAHTRARTYAHKPAAAKGAVLLQQWGRSFQKTQE